MKISASTLLSLSAILFSVSALDAQVIIKGTFSKSESGASLQDTAPDTNLPGGKFSTKGYFGATSYNQNQEFGNPPGSAEMGGSATLLIPIASTDHYKKPASITISADLRLGSIDNDTQTVRGIFLGFRGDVFLPETDPTGTFGYSGLQFAPDGTVYLRTGPDTTDGLKILGKYDATVLGDFRPEDFYNLSYTVNTATGAYSNAVLTRVTGPHAGASAKLAVVPTKTFVDANTNAAVSYVDAHDPNVYGQIDNLIVAGPNKADGKR